MQTGESARLGMENAVAKLETAARSLRAANRNPVQPLEDTVDLSGAAVLLIKARTEFQANAEVFAAGDEIAKRTIDLLA
jgi:cell division GTPase FtsZ